MPQIQIIGPSRNDLMKEQLALSLGQGLGQFATSFLANKSLQNVLTDPNLKDAPLSEKQSRLQMAMAPYGQHGQRMLETSLQIQQQQQAEKMFKGARKVANDPNASPSDILLSLMEAGQGVPGSERYIAPAFDSLMQQRKTKGIINSGSGGQQVSQLGNYQGQPPQNAQSQVNPAMPGQNVTSQGGVPNQNTQFGSPAPRNQQAPQQASNANPQQNNPIFPQAGGQNQGVQVGATSGLYAGITPEEEINRKASAAQEATQDPSVYDLVYQREQARNAEKLAQNKQYLEGQQLETQRQADILARNQQLEGFAKDKLTKKVGENVSEPSSEELNDFMRIGQKYSNHTPNEWFEKTRQDFDKYMNVKSQFDKSFVPGALRGIYLGGEEREKELKTLTPMVQDLKLKYGKGSYARNRLAELGLTQTEIEKVYNPLPKGFTSEIMKLPMGVNPPQKSFKDYTTPTKNSPQIDLVYSSQIGDFLLKNAGSNSLLAMRDEIMNKRHYSFEQYLEGLRMAEEKGLSLNPEQQAEREELRNPPKDSIANIFRGFGNIIEYLRGSR